jgi:hypothetical protein
VESPTDTNAGAESGANADADSHADTGAEIEAEAEWLKMAEGFAERRPTTAARGSFGKARLCRAGMGVD